jgi:hypothetical protein
VIGAGAGEGGGEGGGPIGHAEVLADAEAVPDGAEQAVVVIADGDRPALRPARRDEDGAGPAADTE